MQTAEPTSADSLRYPSTHFPRQLAYLTQTRARSAAEPRGLERTSILQSRGAVLGREFGGHKLERFHQACTAPSAHLYYADAPRLPPAPRAVVEHGTALLRCCQS